MKRGALVLLLSILFALGCSDRPSTTASLAEPPSSQLTLAAQRVPNEPTPERAEAEIELGSPAPAVTLTLHDGFQFQLSQLKGKLIVVYFCASTGSPACVRESQGLRDHWNELHDAHHVAIFGVSPESATTHRAFMTEHNLPFDLVADQAGQLARAFNVPAHATTEPRTFLVGTDGNLRRSWRAADPDAHAQEILAIANEPAKHAAR